MIIILVLNLTTHSSLPGTNLNFSFFFTLREGLESSSVLLPPPKNSEHVSTLWAMSAGKSYTKEF